MKGINIIRAARLFPNSFPIFSESEIRLFDGKGRECMQESVKYARPLFEENPDSLKKFISFLIDFELNPTKDSLEITINEFSVKVQSESGIPKEFPRKLPALSSLDIGYLGRVE